MSQSRIILIDVNDESREVMVRRLSAQGYVVEAAADAATGADLALSGPPSAVIADLWMPSISGVQLCRLLRAEPATADVPVILRGENNDPRSHFWAERAGAATYLVKGRMSELLRALQSAISVAPAHDGFFMQLGGGSVDIRDRIARHLDAALFESVIAAEVRALANCGSFDQLFDAFSQFLSQVISYRWLAVSTSSPSRLALHHHPRISQVAETEARNALCTAAQVKPMRVEDEDARDELDGPRPIVCHIPFGNSRLGTLALGPSSASEPDTAALVQLVARELGGPMRMAALMDESQRLATTDSLTTLMNRHAFLSMMQVEVARSVRYQMPLSILLLDVDHFKSINDSYGHAAGDSVLSAIGRFLRNDMRITDSASRWGGEEFVIALKNTTTDGAQIFGERLRQGIQGLEVATATRKISVTASIGIATLQPSDVIETLMERADRGMYTAKAQGRNRVVVSESGLRVVADERRSSLTGLKSLVGLSCS
jgi:two-component system cell cycle response regulator